MEILFWHQTCLSLFEPRWYRIAGKQTEQSMTAGSMVNARRSTITSGGTGGLLGRGTVHPIGTGRYVSTTRAQGYPALARRAGADVVWLFPPVPVVEVARRAALRVAPMEA